MSIQPNPVRSPGTPSSRSNITTRSLERDFDAELALDADEVADEGIKNDAIHFVLLAEFDIDAGATLAHQYPYPTGTDEQYVSLRITLADAL
jgi:hypothetical protein